MKWNRLRAVRESLQSGRKASSKRRARYKARRGLRYESLENRALMSVTAGDLDIIETGGGSAVTEGSATGDSYTVALKSQPETGATVAVNITADGELQLVSPANSQLTSAITLTFNSTNWSTPQTVFFNALNDSEAEGTHTGTISHVIGTSGTPQVLTATITDNDVAGLIIGESGNTTNVAEGSTTVDTYTVRLSSKPAGDVKVTVTADGQLRVGTGAGATASTVELTFTTLNWDTAQVVNVLAVDDTASEGNHTGTITHTVTSTADSAYNSLPADKRPGVTANITDNDTIVVGFQTGTGTVSEPSGTTATTRTIPVVLTLPAGTTLAQALTLNVAVVASGTTAASGTSGDYVLSTQTITFNQGASSGAVVNVSLNINHDVNVESSETVRLELSNPSPATIGGKQVIVDATKKTHDLTITDNDTATVEFVDLTSTAREIDGTAKVQVRLVLPAGGKLEKEVKVDVAALTSGSGAGTATLGTDYTFGTNGSTTLTFPVGTTATSGHEKTIDITLTKDTTQESDETIKLELKNLNAGGTSTSLSTTRAAHTVTIDDDPASGVLSGFVYGDVDDDGVKDTGEVGVPGVFVRLTGTTTKGLAVERITMTDGTGRYRFEGLQAGTYQIAETQPTATMDGKETAGKIDGANAGTAGADQFTGLTLAAGKQGDGYNFGEKSLRPQFISKRLFFSSTTSPNTIIRSMIARGEETASKNSEAAAIRRGSVAEVQRLGSKVTVVGTSAVDVFSFTPGTTTAKHKLQVNGKDYEYAVADVKEIVFDGKADSDRVTLNDSTGNDTLEMVNSRPRLSGLIGTSTYSVEMLAVERLKAISKAGGTDSDKINRSTIDFTLETEGNWKTT